MKLSLKDTSRVLNSQTKIEDFQLDLILKTNNPDMEFNLVSTLTVDETDYQAKAIYYTLMETSICCIQLFAVVKLIRYVNEGEMEGNNQGNKV